MEKWKEIEGYTDYMVSNLGNVKSLKFDKEINLKSLKTKNGYFRVELYKDGKRKRKLIHRLVAEAFIPNSDNKPCIDHINTDKTDNRVENLRWCTQEENMNNPFTKEKMSISNIGKLGREHHLSKSILQFSKDGEFIKKWDSIADANREFGILNGHISNCCGGIRKTAYGYKWGYESDYERIHFNVFDLEIYKKKVA